MKLVFEDSGETAISQLLRHAYKDCTNDVIVFSKGNRNLVNCLSSIDKRDTVIVFVDVMPDKFSTIEAYKCCIDYVKSNNLTNIYVLPIPCIEYFVIKEFVSDSEDVMSAVLNFSDYRHVSVNCKNKTLSRLDFEAFCKSVLHNYKSCFKDSKVLDTLDSFYNTSCVCNTGLYKSGCVPLDLDLKAWRLVCSLPAFFTTPNNCYVKTRVADMNSVIRSCVELYYKICSLYLDAGIIAEIPVLPN